MSTSNGDLLRRDRAFVTPTFRAGRELRNLDRRGVLEAREIDIRAALYQREQDHAEFATFERIHSARLLTGAARAAVETDAATSPLVASALQDWDAAVGRSFRRTFG
jgi:hypothetical protein